jgi:hypothetical protein
MTFLLATIPEALIIGTCVFAVCLGLIYLLFFRGKLHEMANSFTNRLNIAQAMSEADYELITERLIQVEGKYTTILFAASSPMSMPVTIPVNVSVCLAHAGKRCLLIDMDTQRNAIAKAFEIDENAGGELDTPRAYKTSFDNLRLWPAHNFSHKNMLRLADVIKGAKNEFDFIIITASNLDESPKQKQIITDADCGFIFSPDAEDTTKLSSLMKTARCSVIGNVKVSPV